MQDKKKKKKEKADSKREEPNKNEGVYTDTQRPCRNETEPV